MKRNFTATYSGGSIITRTSTHDYTHAWRVNFEGANFQHGFSSSKEGAEKAARRIVSFYKDEYQRRGIGSKWEIEVVPAHEVSK